MEEKELLDVISRLRLIGQEIETIDAKQKMSLKEMGEKAELAKDVAAMANNGVPSYIVIGLVDKSFHDVGKLQHTYNKSDINQILADKIDPPIAVDYKEFKIGENEYGLIKIVGTNPPYIIARDVIHNLSDQKKVRIYKGMIYVRRQDVTDGASRAELEQILNTSIRKWFQDTSNAARKIAIEKPDFWEYLLTIELWRHNYREIKRLINDLDRGLVFVKAKAMSGSEFFKFSREKMDDVVAFIAGINKIINEDVIEAWGKPGEPGDPIEIKRSTDRLKQICIEIIQLEAEIRSVSVPSSFFNLKSMMGGWASHFYSSINEGYEELAAVFENPNPTGTYNITIPITAPPKTQEIFAELERLHENMGDWIDDF